MELDAFREWVKGVQRLQLGITSISDEPVHLLELGRDN